MSLEQLFALLPQTTGMAFVVIQHLSPDYPSLMDELLGRVTQMKVTMAVDGEELEANHVYLLPPAKQMITLLSIYKGAAVIEKLSCQRSA